MSPPPSPDDDALPPDEEVVIRQAEQADLLDVFRLERSTFPQPWPFSAFESFLGERGFLVAQSGTSPAIVGYVVSDTTPNYGRDIGHVKDLAVHPDARGRGLGRTLLRRALGTLASDGSALVKLEVRTTNDAAIALYRSEGFEPLRRIPRYYADGEDAFVMVLDLAEWDDSPLDGNDSGGRTRESRGA
ncbi:ribosomal-protein-alanine N-acetyltransferase [Salinigranum rubrum]|uniref:Ribosomal-protein-alanine N-acetyltransferase n=1 Tax=Salinigranum rubrum TaxID=755307 RepID=A0A2I8VN30_9EURY|nr:ribosomal protein S18-alanine N-acetyltransferase [Salinigranum rubrum]AUV83321.1 ribosomal-protein-alanine N-acetyltransferase [Salinigranum rubrum]